MAKKAVKKRAPINATAPKPQEKREAPLPLKSAPVQQIHRSKLANAPYNPRKIDSAARRKLRDGLKRFGLVQPPVWNETTGNLVGGHQRLEAADTINGTDDYEIEVSVVKLTEKKERELNVLLNNPSAQGYYDVPALMDMIRDDTIPLDIESMGFEDIEIEYMATEMGLESPLFDSMVDNELINDAVDDIDRAMEDSDEAKRIEEPPEPEGGNDDEPGEKSEDEKIAEIKKNREEFAERAAVDYEHSFFATIVFPSDAMKRAFVKLVGMDEKKTYLNWREIITHMSEEFQSQMPEPADLEESAV